MPKKKIEWLQYQRKISKESNIGFMLIFATSIYCSFYDLTALWGVFSTIIWYFVMVYILYCKFQKRTNGKETNT